MRSESISKTNPKRLRQPPVAAKSGSSRAGALAAAGRRQREVLGRILASEWSAPEQREELDAHFQHMPDRYWTRVDAAAVRWHLAVVHAFYHRLGTEGAQALAPVVRWRHFPERQLTEVAVGTWDRPALLTRVAQAFARAGIGILRAEIYRRADQVMLAVFQVADRQFEFVPRERLLEETVKALEFLAGAEPEPVGEWNPGPRQDNAWVGYDALSSPDFTVLMVEALDRLGLLYVIFREINASGLQVAQAMAVTEQDIAGAVFFLTDEAGRRVADSAKLEALRERLRNALALPRA